MMVSIFPSEPGALECGLVEGGTEAESKVEGEDRVRKMVYRGWYVGPF